MRLKYSLPASSPPKWWQLKSAGATSCSRKKNRARSNRIDEIHSTVRTHNRQMIWCRSTIVYAARASAFTVQFARVDSLRVVINSSRLRLWLSTKWFCVTRWATRRIDLSFLERVVLLPSNPILETHRVVCCLEPPVDSHSSFKALSKVSNQLRSHKKFSNKMAPVITIDR